MERFVRYAFFTIKKSLLLNFESDQSGSKFLKLAKTVKLVIGPDLEKDSLTYNVIWGGRLSLIWLHQ